MVSKISLRKKVMKRRKNMNAADFNKASKLICDHLINFADWQNINSVLVYLPIANNREVDISAFINYLIKLPGNLQIFVPDFDRKNPVHFKFRSLKDDNLVNDADFEIVIVPALAVDKNKYRLGYGGGYYDRLLHKYPRARIVTPIFSQDVFESIPHETHDEIVDAVITEVS